MCTVREDGRGGPRREKGFSQRLHWEVRIQESLKGKEEACCHVGFVEGLGDGDGSLSWLDVSSSQLLQEESFCQPNEASTEEESLNYVMPI